MCIRDSLQTVPLRKSLLFSCRCSSLYASYYCYLHTVTLNVRYCSRPVCEMLYVYEGLLCNYIRSVNSWNGNNSAQSFPITSIQYNSWDIWRMFKQAYFTLRILFSQKTHVRAPKHGEPFYWVGLIVIINHKKCNMRLYVITKNTCTTFFNNLIRKW